MVCGDVPFKLVKDILKAKTKFSRELTPGCMNIINQCLIIDSLQRPTIKGMFDNPWVKQVTIVHSNNNNSSDNYSNNNYFIV